MLRLQVGTVQVGHRMHGSEFRIGELAPSRDTRTRVPLRWPMAIDHFRDLMDACRLFLPARRVLHGRDG